MPYCEEEYINILKKGDVDEIIDYIKLNTPNLLLKFFSFSSDNFDDLDNKKMNTFSKNKIWFSNYMTMNDPFDLANFYIDELTIPEDFPKKEELVNTSNKILESVREGFSYASFSNTTFENTMMWAHYANNYNGFCCEFEIDREKALWGLFRPVVYNLKPSGFHLEEVSNFVAYSILSRESIINGERLLMGDREKRDKIMRFMITNVSYKDSSWEKEMEFRYYYCFNPQTTDTSLDFSLLGLKLSKIYVGYKCNYEKKLMLYIYSVTNNIEIFEVYPDQEKHVLNKKVLKIDS